MILNTYAVLVAFVAGLRLVAALGVIRLAAGAWASAGRAPDPDERDGAQDRVYLLFLLALVLVVLDLAAWPLLYLLLQSYVPEWPGVMCVYGVTRVGTGSTGPARILPDLLRVAQVTKPALVFAGGAWFVLYVLDRRTVTGPLLGRLVWLLVPLGALAAADAAADLAYVATPKKEVFRQSGCCTAGPEADAGRLLPSALAAGWEPVHLSSAYYGATGVVVLGLLFATRRGPTPLTLVALAGGGGAALLAGGLYIDGVAAPAILKRPDHHCVYDLIPAAPGAVGAVVVLAAGGFFLGWACLAHWLGRCPETKPYLAGMTRWLLLASALGYAVAAALLALAVAVA
jgi:hypothetical protein